MKTETSIKKNFLMNIILSMSSFIFPLITFPYISRTLSPEAFGKVSFANAFMTYLVNVSLLGIPVYGIRICAKYRDDREKLSKVFQEIFGINIITCLLTYLMFFIMLYSIPNFYKEKELFLLISLSILFYDIGVDWLYKAKEQYSYITKVSLLFKFISVVLMLVLVKSSDDYVIYGGITIFAAAASNLINFLRIPKFIDIKVLNNLNFRQHIRPILTFFAMSCAVTIYIHLDSVMLGFMSTNEEVGYYNVAIKFKVILVSVVTSLGAVLLPRLTYYLKHEMYDKFEEITEKALNFLLFIAIPLAMFFVLYAREAILLIATEKYNSSIELTQIIMLTVPIIALTNLMGIQLLIPLEREGEVLKSEVFGAIVNVVLNWMLIPVLAAKGAAIGTVMAELTVLFVQFYATKEILWKKFKRIRIYEYIASMSAAIIMSVFFSSFMDGVFIKLVISSVVFFLTYYCVMLWTGNMMASFIKLTICEKLKGMRG